MCAWLQPVGSLDKAVALHLWLLQRLELEQVESVGQPVLALEQAQAALRDLPEELKESFQ